MYESKYVIPLYRCQDDTEVIDGKTYWCLLLVKGSKILYHIINTERFTDVDKLCYYGKDLAKAILHMHEKDTIHVDVILQNIVRASDGDIKLIDLDATVRVGKDLIYRKKSTTHISHEVAKEEFFVTERFDDLDTSKIIELKNGTYLRKKTMIDLTIRKLKCNAQIICINAK